MSIDRRVTRTIEAKLDIPALGSLGPAYEESLHGRHAAILLKILTDKSGNVAKNVALAGHYGSGKSSVILGVEARLDELGINWVNLSLSSLGIDDTERARIKKDGTLPPLTNLIQKEIVKQLLYRKAPSEMPGSRYFRIDSFRNGPAALWSGVVGIGFFVITVLFGLVNRVEKVAPGGIVSGRDWAPWVIVAAIGAFLGAVWFLGLRGMQNRLRVESLSAGGAAVSLSAKENSYFDEYLDEIVYFFQQTKTEVAFFEDLDRFKDPHIFETLREVNTVLNNSEQIKSRPIRFVYAVRDSIFEQLEVVSNPDGQDVGEAGPALRASALESSPSANRTKFFDLVVPMVPFITHRSARDLLAAEFAESDAQPSTALVNLVGVYLTDMRLIRNIRNEFEIYSAAVLSDNGLQGLTADRLFAMMVYKNLHLDDFEAIRLGTSTIDEAHRAFRAAVRYQVDRQAELSKSALDQAASSAVWDKRAEAAGARLEKVLPIIHRASRRGGAPTVTHQSNSYELTSLTSGALWKSLYESDDGVTIGGAGGASTQLSLEDLVELVGDAGGPMDVVVAADAARLRRASQVALETKDFVAKATMAELMARTNLVVPCENGDERNLDATVEELVSPLAHELLAKGYIDENFTLYCSDYHAIAISVSAMNFILHSVQEDSADHRFRFDESASIDSVESEMGARFLEGESVFNIEVFDHYLTGRQSLLENALDKLVERVATDSSFLDAYLMDGASAEALVAELADRWKGLFVYLVEKAAIDLEATIALVDAAARNAVPDVDYKSSDRVAEFFSDHYPQMRALVGADVDASKAADVAALLCSLDARIRDLTVLGDTQREAVVTSGLYPLTRRNLWAALGKGVELALDVVEAAGGAVYEHILANLADYLDVLDEGEVTIARPENFVDVLGDVVDAAGSAVLRVAEGASESCTVVDLTELDEAAWPAVVSSGRFAPSASNISHFVSEFGTSGELIEHLADRDITQVEELDAEARIALGYALAGTPELHPDARVRLVGQLELNPGLDPRQLTDSGLAVLPALLGAGLVPDASETYTLVSDHPFAYREDYFAASKELPSYVSELSLSSEDLDQMMRSQRVKPAVKRALVDDVEFVRGRLSRQGAIAICVWANEGNEVSEDLLVLLSETQAPAEHVLGLLAPHLSDVELPVLERILLALGDDYEPLTRVGRHRPRLKDHDGTEELLDELRRRDRVSSFGATKWGGGIRVNMRH